MDENSPDFHFHNSSGNSLNSFSTGAKIIIIIALTLTSISWINATIKRGEIKHLNEKLSNSAEQIEFLEKENDSLLTICDSLLMQINLIDNQNNP